MCFSIKKFVEDYKKNIYITDFLCQIIILLLDMQKLFKVPGFFMPKLSNFSFFIFFQIFQIKLQPCLMVKLKKI